jgi:histone H3/H4
VPHSNVEVPHSFIIVRQIADEFSKTTHDEYQGPNRERGIRFQPQALAAIQEAVESSIASLYEDANLCCSHAKRVTLFDRDVILARRIRGDAF